MFNSSANMYTRVSTLGDSKQLSVRAIESVKLYLDDLVNEQIEWTKRCEAGFNAVTLLSAVSQNIRDEIGEEEQVILIKIFGQIIKNTNKYIRKEIGSLEKEFAGLRLILKLIS